LLSLIDSIQSFEATVFVTEVDLQPTHL
jgi:hypothetical protein